MIINIVKFYEVECFKYLNFICCIHNSSLDKGHKFTLWIGLKFSLRNCKVSFKYVIDAFLYRLSSQPHDVEPLWQCYRYIIIILAIQHKESYHSIIYTYAHEMNLQLFFSFHVESYKKGANSDVLLKQQSDSK